MADLVVQEPVHALRDRQAVPLRGFDAGTSIMQDGREQAESQRQPQGDADVAQRGGGTGSRKPCGIHVH